MSFTSRRRDLALAIGARAVSLLGDQIALTALTLRLSGSGHQAGAVAGLLCAGMLPMVLLAGPAGRLVDRIDSRALLVPFGAAQAVTCLALAASHGLPATLVLVALLGGLETVVAATWQALLPGIAGERGLSSALGLSQAAGTLAFVAGPAAGGLLTARFGSAAPLLVDAVSFLAVAGAGMLVSARRGGPAGGRAAAARGGLALVLADPLLRLLLALLGVFAVLGAMVNPVEVFLVRDTLHGSATWYGLIGAALGAGLFAGPLVATRLHGGPALTRGLVASAAALAATLAGFAAAPSVGWLLPAALLCGAANGVLNVTVGALVMLRAPEQARGRIAATVGGVASGAQVGAYVLGGLLAGPLTPREIYLLAGLSALLGPLAFGRRLLRNGARDVGPPAGDLAACRPAARPTSQGASSTARPRRPQIADWH